MPASEPTPAPKRDLILTLIALLKLLKGALLLIIGTGALKLLHHDVSQTLAHWITLVRIDPDNRYIHSFLSWSLSIDDHKLREIGFGSFFYASFLLTEGVGLLLRKRWAEYLTVFITGSLIPLEIYALTRHANGVKVSLLVLNVMIVLYLVRLLARSRE